jgi:hypothetical protein
VPLLFAVTLFVSASLLFMVQPMVGKLVLPLLGGSPAVWNACMVFFQALLLLGYLYADRVTRIENVKRQWTIHLAVMSLPVAAFALAIAFGSRNTPIAVAESLAPTDGGSAIISVLLILTVAIGIPFFVCSTSATLLQKWFTYTGHPSARDPYFLYSASNAGSLISLLGYPILIEPNMTQGGQTWVFAAGFLGLFALIAFCGRAAANPLGAPPSGKSAQAAAGPTAPEAEPTFGRMAKWTLLAFVPSSLMLGVTFHMTTDIASIPLLWVGPLALYLITFIISFGRVPSWFRILIGNLAPVMILLLVFLLISGVNPGTGLSLLLHLATFFAAALMCHYELARDRPSPKYLTTYFLIMSFGGVLGGIFNSLLAPLVFPHAYEYQLALLVACLMVPKLTGESEKDDKGNPLPPPPKTPQEQKAADLWERISLALDFVIPLLVGIAFWQMGTLLRYDWYQSLITKVAETVPFNIGPKTVNIIIVYALPVMVCFFFVDRPLRFALCVAAILGPTTYREAGSSAMHSERSFFGILKIEESDGYESYLMEPGDGERQKVVRNANNEPVLMHQLKFRRLVHGTTLHGTQVSEHKRHVYDQLQLMTFGNLWDNIAVAGAQHSYDARQEPLTYYHRTGPVGAMFQELLRRGRENDHVAMVGLGTGSVSCYARPGQKLTFYEIDPLVTKLVADTDKYFTYVRDAKNRGALLDFRMGDARLKLKETDDKYSLLLVDAFSSDSIPVHLLTVEAVRLYLERMKDDGILALHISNKYVRLEPVVAAIAKELGLVAYVWNDDDGSGLRKFGKTASSWVALARKKEHLGDRLASPAGDLVGLYDGGTQLGDAIKASFPASPKDTDGPLGGTRLVRLLKLIVPEFAAAYPNSVPNSEEAAKWLADRPDAHARAYAAVLRQPALPDKLGTLIEKLYPDVLAAAKAEGKAIDKWLEERDPAGKRYAELARRYGADSGLQSLVQTETLIGWLDAQKGDATAARYAEWLRKYRSEYTTLMTILQNETGHAFRPVIVLEGVEAWTDDYADVMRVMMIKELQLLRKFFGLPTPVDG